LPPGVFAQEACSVGIERWIRWRSLRHCGCCIAVPGSADLHHGLIAAVKADRIDAGFRGPMMCNLPDALSSGYRGGYAGSAAEFESQMVAAIRASVIVVKGLARPAHGNDCQCARKGAFPTKPRPMLRRCKAV
jgi:hypothetical protein